MHHPNRHALADHVGTVTAFRNPLVRQRADPWICLHEGWYYFTGTVPEYDRIELRRARTIDDLGAAPPTVLWRRHAQGAMGAHIWAPELHRIDGTWFIYFTAGRAEDPWHLRPYILECAADDPLGGEWVERGRLETGHDAYALDANTFAHAGRLYLVWAERPSECDKGTSIYIAPMAGPLALAGPAVMLSRPEHPWEKPGDYINEGPAAIVRHGRVFITYSAGAIDASYCMGMLHAPDDADLLDAASWTKSPEPVFRSSRETGQWGPGHNAFTTTPDGMTDVLVYHARDYCAVEGDPLCDPNRHARAQAFGWDADGMPDFGVPVPDAAGVRG